MFQQRWSSSQNGKAWLRSGRKQRRWKVKSQQRPQERHHPLYPESCSRLSMSRRKLPFTFLSQDEEGRVSHETVQEEIQRRMSYLQAAHCVVLLSCKNVPGGEVSGTILSEHQAETSPATDAATFTERSDDATTNGANERVQNPEQFSVRNGPSKANRVSGTSSNRHRRRPPTCSRSFVTAGG